MWRRNQRTWKLQQVSVGKKSIKIWSVITTENVNVIEMVDYWELYDRDRKYRLNTVDSFV